MKTVQIYVVSVLITYVLTHLKSDVEDFLLEVLDKKKLLPFSDLISSNSILLNILEFGAFILY